ncbi:hypothetical protein GCM10027396_13740 [Insolitispirillum peregrinum]
MQQTKQTHQGIPKAVSANEGTGFAHHHCGRTKHEGYERQGSQPEGIASGATGTPVMLSRGWGARGGDFTLPDHGTKGEKAPDQRALHVTQSHWSTLLICRSDSAQNRNHLCAYTSRPAPTPRWEPTG